MTSTASTKGTRKSLANENRKAKIAPAEPTLRSLLFNPRSSLASSRKQLRITLQTVPEEDEDFSEKEIAASRYMRNHRLIMEIFSDAVVPDVRSVVVNSHLERFKMHTESLLKHREKAKSEQMRIEERFQERKRKLTEYKTSTKRMKSD